MFTLMSCRTLPATPMVWRWVRPAIEKRYVTSPSSSSMVRNWNDTSLPQEVEAKEQDAHRGQLLSHPDLDTLARFQRDRVGVLRLPDHGQPRAKRCRRAGCNDCERIACRDERA